MTVRLGKADGALAEAFAAIRSELGVSEGFPDEVEAEAAEAVKSATRPGTDLLHIPLFTIDPEGSMDLDQAMHLERDGDGFRVWYAIADLPAFVVPGGAIDSEARRRGQTLYAPDGRIPLHPIVISEGAASLLPDQERGAYVWAFELDHDARVTTTTLVMAQVRSRARLSYQQVQKQLDDGTAGEAVLLLEEVGRKRQILEQERGGASLQRPDQEVAEVDGRYELIRRRPLAVEGWNAQLSLMTGMAAATIMLDGRIGILRTMPPPDDESTEWFRRRAQALGRPWESGQGYGAYLRTLDTADPKQLAIMSAAASLFRGAGYTAFDGELPESTVQAAVAAPYAHATAPLRRLVDRFTLVVCEALANGRKVPDWVREALPALPAIMAASGNLAGQLENRAVSAVEAAVLSKRIGETFEATVISSQEGKGVIQLASPAVTATCDGELLAGERIEATLVRADIAAGIVVFHRAGGVVE